VSYNHRHNFNTV